MGQQLLDLEIIESIRDVGDVRDSDGFARELFDLFSEQSDLAVRELTSAVSRDDLAQVRYFAHRLKGSAANIGARALSRQAEELENVARGDGDGESLRGLTVSLGKLREESLRALAASLLGSPSAEAST